MSGLLHYKQYRLKSNTVRSFNFPSFCYSPEEKRMRLVLKDKSCGSTFILNPKENKDLISWADAIASAIETVSPTKSNRYGHVLQMTTFFEITMCSQCKKSIKGKFYQGYRCLRCLSNLHKKCLAYQECIES